MTVTSSELLPEVTAAPPLVPALGPARLTATAPANGQPAEWEEHARVHGEPLTALRSGSGGSRRAGGGDPIRRRPAGLAAGLHGGAKRSRTADLLNAIQALYQLSYSPKVFGRRGT